MEVSILPKGTLRVKSRQATFLIDPASQVTGINAALFLKNANIEIDEDSVVVIDGPGDFEIGGVKIVGTRSGDGVVYSLLVDGVDMLIGDVTAIEKIQHKVKEHSLLILNANEDSSTDAAFATGLATNVLLTYGTKGKALADTFGKENPLTMSKYSVTKDKLPSEMTSILLQ